MLQRILPKLALSRMIILVFFLPVVIGIILISVVYQRSPWNTANAVAVYAPPQISPGLPMRLKIPKMNLNVAIQQIGLTADLAMDVPKSPADVAWFKLGVRPGEIGSAVIAGHYGWKNGRAAAFDNLSKLRVGDKFSITDKKGIATTFVVSSIKKYDQKADATDVFVSNDDKSHVNLITCQGSWNKSLQSYSNRLVVFADKIE